VLDEFLKRLVYISLGLTIICSLALVVLVKTYKTLEFKKILDYGLPVQCYSEKLHKEVYIDSYTVGAGYINDLRRNEKFPIDACHF